MSDDADIAKRCLDYVRTQQEVRPTADVVKEWLMRELGADAAHIGVAVGPTEIHACVYQPDHAAASQDASPIRTIIMKFT